MIPLNKDIYDVLMSVSDRFFWISQTVQIFYQIKSFESEIKRE